MLSGTQRTFRVGDRHYALVTIEGLRPGTSTDYEVRLDGEKVWPPADSSFPPPRIRTPRPGGAVRLAFGSCRYASPLSVISDGRYGTDALDAYARALATAPTTSGRTGCCCSATRCTRTRPRRSPRT